jgi:glutamate synthase domain-containing protein 2
MSIKIAKDGFTFEVDTADEFEFVMRALRHNHAAEAVNKQPSAVKPKSLTEFYQSLEHASKQRRIIGILRDKPQGITDNELRSALNLETGPALGGVLGALSKMANKASLSIADMVETRIGQDENGSSAYLYRLTDEMREAIKNVK